MGTGIGYGDIEEVLQRILGQDAGFAEMVTELTESGTLSGGAFLSVIKDSFFTQIEGYREMLFYLMLLLLSAAILAAVTRAFSNHQISDMGFYMIYLLLILVLMQVFGECYELTRQMVTDLLDFMKVLMPAYLMAAAAASYRTSAAVFYEGFLILVYYLQRIVLHFVLPAIRGYCLLVLAGHLGSTDFFSRGRQQIRKLISLVLKAMIGVSAGLQFIQGMITPAIDSMQQTALSKGVSGLGSMGNVAQGVMDIILGSGVLLKNGIGAAAAVLIVVISLLPALRVGIYVFFFQLLAVVTEPVTDGRLNSAIGEMGEGLGLLVKLQFTVAALFLLTIAVVCVTTGGLR
ncbi:MAG: stage III sporulation protein AE [Lachnospiraceae bacterium]